MLSQLDFPLVNSLSCSRRDAAATVISSRRDWRIRLTPSFIHESKGGFVSVCLFVHWFVTTVPLSMKLGEMINHRQDNGKNIIPHRIHSGVFKMAQQAKLLSPSRWIPQTLLRPILTKTCRSKVSHLLKNDFLAQRGSRNYCSKHSDMFVTDCPSFVGEKTLTVAMSQLCLQVCVCRLLC